MKLVGNTKAALIMGEDCLFLENLVSHPARSLNVLPRLRYA